MSRLTGRPATGAFCGSWPASDTSRRSMPGLPDRWSGVSISPTISTARTAWGRWSRSNPTRRWRMGSSAEAIVDHVMTSDPGTVTLAVTGPMTNVALALRQEPAIAARLKRIVAMGGARAEGGNITASAEYNIWADPEAAHEVLSSDVEVVMLGLDVTHQVRTPDAVIQTIRTIGTPAAEACAAMLDYGQYTARKWGEGQEGPMHDPCVIAYILRPDLFELRPCTIQVETVSDLTRGHTQVEFRVPAGHDAAQLGRAGRSGRRVRPHRPGAEAVGMKIAVLGSINLDIVASGAPLPRAGETVSGATLAQHPGGKGANQAYAALRLGADTVLFGRVGERRLRRAGAGAARTGRGGPRPCPD
jgi:inosine-uridine nucleoside N-ribohydrolase